MNDALVTPAMRVFDREIAPRIRSASARAGGLFGSQSIRAEADALEGIQVGLQSQLAQAVLQNQRLQAQLAENAQARSASTALGLSQLDQNRINQALGFTGQSHLFAQQRPTAFGSALGVAGGVLGAGLGLATGGLSGGLIGGPLTSLSQGLFGSPAGGAGGGGAGGGVGLGGVIGGLSGLGGVR